MCPTNTETPIAQSSNREKLDNLAEKYDLKLIQTYQDILVVEGLAHLSTQALEQFEHLSGYRTLEKNQLNEKDHLFLQNNGSVLNRQGAVTQTEPQTPVDLEQQLTEVSETVEVQDDMQHEEPKAKKITLSEDPFLAKAEIFMHLCRLNSSWDSAAKELIKCFVHVGYGRGQLFFVPNTGEPLKMHWQKVGKKKLFLGKPAKVSADCLASLKHLKQTQEPSEIDATDPLLDFYTYDEASQSRKKLLWNPVNGSFKLYCIFEASNSEVAPSVISIMRKSAEFAFQTNMALRPLKSKSTTVKQ